MAFLGKTERNAIAHKSKDVEASFYGNCSHSRMSNDIEQKKSEHSTLEPVLNMAGKKFQLELDTVRMGKFFVRPLISLCVWWLGISPF